MIMILTGYVDAFDCKTKQIQFIAKMIMLYIYLYS